MKEKEDKKPIYKKWWFWLIVIIILGVICATSENGDIEMLNNSEETSMTEQENKEEVQNKYSNKIQWTNNGTKDSIQSLKIAVEKEKYEGDNIEAGTYTCKQTNTIYEENTERIYNIFVSNIEYNNIEDVPMSDWKGLIGGKGNDNELEINVEKGQFIYLQTNLNGQHGNIIIEKK